MIKPPTPTIISNIPQPLISDYSLKLCMVSGKCKEKCERKKINMKSKKKEKVKENKKK